MLPERFFLGQPVRSLQMMLRELSFRYDFIPRIIPDGVFEEETRRAVVAFQQNFGLTPNGVVDNDTWDAIVVVYRRVVPITRRPRLAEVFPAPDYVVLPGDSKFHMLVIQSMFKALYPLLDGIQDVVADGNHTGKSVENALWLQRRAGLRETGAIDSLTWAALARLYCTFVTRNPNL